MYMSESARGIIVGMYHIYWYMILSVSRSIRRIIDVCYIMSMEITAADAALNQSESRTMLDVELYIL